MGKKLTQEDFEKQVAKKYGNRYTVIGRYIDWKTPVKIKCNRCGHEFERTPNSITAKNKNTCCPLCEATKITNEIIYGKTDLWGTDPDVACLLEDSETGHKYSRCSEFKAWFVCPDCGHRHFEKIRNVTKRGFKCKCCGATPYYPNQFLYNLLDIAGISFDTEYRIAGHPYRYDARFVFNNKQYVVEMDGGYGHGCVETKNRTIEQQLYDDNQKDLIADRNGFEVIRIDCKYSGNDDRFSYVKNSIKNSTLFDLFHFTDDDFTHADKMANISKIKLFLEYWNCGIRSYDEFGKYLHKCRSTIRKYIKLAADYHMINCSYNDALKEMRIACNRKIVIAKGIPVMCNETGEVYNSISEAERMTGISSIQDYFSKNNKYGGVLSDGTKLTWTKLKKII